MSQLTRFLRLCYTVSTVSPVFYVKTGKNIFRFFNGEKQCINNINIKTGWNDLIGIFYKNILMFGNESVSSDSVRVSVLVSLLHRIFRELDNSVRKFQV